ncbi:hypothetical protein [Ruegeria arenilitoris]|uniref:hypothetical protein n=1 Tax=Ruegeria arenilitoris TaxID=1173585 RepID=UPI001C2CBD7F|nr:hypothetical protein [Ruegeria arenilitoris]
MSAFTDFELKAVLSTAAYRSFLVSCLVDVQHVAVFAHGDGIALSVFDLCAAKHARKGLAHGVEVCVEISEAEVVENTSKMLAESIGRVSV